MKLVDIKGHAIIGTHVELSSIEIAAIRDKAQELLMHQEIVDSTEMEAELAKKVKRLTDCTQSVLRLLGRMTEDTNTCIAEASEELFSDPKENELEPRREKAVAEAIESSLGA